MRELQEQIIKDLNVKAVIDPAGQIRKRVQFLCQYYKASAAKGFVLGVSGGVDSTLAGRLCQLAVEQLELEGIKAEFIALRLPYKVQADEAAAQAALAFIQPQQSLTLNIADTVDNFAGSFAEAGAGQLTDFSKGNVKARARMLAQYALAGQKKLLVVGTDHAAESVTGFFTKFGDGAADLLPLAGLTKRQNRSLLKVLGAQPELWQKTPTADLLDQQPGRSDEEELGLSYDHIDDYLEGKQIDQQAAQLIEQKYLQSRHKRKLPATLFDPWWQG